jgi:hypothetical protein
MKADALVALTSCEHTLLINCLPCYVSTCKAWQGWMRKAVRPCIVHREAKEQLATSVSRPFSAGPHVLKTFIWCGACRAAKKTRSAGSASRNLPRGIISAAGIPVLAPAIRRNQPPCGLEHPKVSPGPAESLPIARSRPCSSHLTTQSTVKARRYRLMTAT